MRRQIAAETKCFVAPVRKDGAMFVRLRPYTPMDILYCEDGINAKVHITICDWLSYYICDVYLVDCYGNTVWCEKDAINPVGKGRVFECGEDIKKIIVVVRFKHFWRRLVISSVPLKIEIDAN